MFYDFRYKVIELRQRNGTLPIENEKPTNVTENTLKLTKVIINKNLLENKVMKIRYHF